MLDELPAANPLLMLALQVGMFAFWATVATAPRVFLDRRELGRQARRWIVRFFVPYFALVYSVGLSVPESLRFAILIPLIVVGYSVVTGLLFKWVVDLSRNPQAILCVNAEGGPDMLTVPCDPEPKSLILDAPVNLQTTGPRERPLSHGVHMRTHIRQLRCEHVSATEAEDGFQVLFAKAPDSDEGYVLIQRHFEFPDRGECYVETDDREFCGHFRIQSAHLSRNQLEIAFDREPVKEIAVLFSTTDPVYAEVSRVLRIMIPEIDIS